ncbi:MAG: VWA domain-containing protein [Vicinamibacterales bacterium]
MHRQGFRRIVFVAAAAIAAAGVVSARAIGELQEPAGTNAPVFRASADLVVLHVTVLDRRSDAVPDLPQDAFTVFEDGRPQDIAFFAGGDVPVAAGLVIDNSSSMIGRRPMVVAGARAFAEAGHPEDELFTVIFNEHVRLGLPPAVTFTQSAPMLLASLAAYPPGGRTALYDAVIDALAHLDTSSLQKRVLLVLSDGDDNASRHTRQDMFDKVMASDAIVYTSVNRLDSGGPSDAGTLRRLAELSGGVAYSSDTEREVIQSFADIAGNIRRGYSIGYVPAERSSRKFHDVKVVARSPGRGSLNTRVRRGYVTGDNGDGR